MYHNCSQRATYGVLPIRFFLKFGISIFEFTLNFDPIHGVCNPLERRDGGQQILPSPKSDPRHSCKNPGMEFRREIPKQNMGAHTNSFVWEWAELAIATRIQEPRGRALQVSLVPPGLRPRPLSPPYPTLLSSPSSPAGGHITHNGGDCPGGAHGPWRHGKGTHPKKRNAWQAFRAHNPPQMQCTFLQKCKKSAVHFSEKCKKSATEVQGVCSANV